MNLVSNTVIFQILECLWRNKWTSFDGLGALIITPTRELAVQIFKVLNKIGVNHDFSIALLIGGRHIIFVTIYLHTYGF